MKIEVTKNGKTITTTVSSYNNYLKNNGWKVAGEIPATEPVIEEVVVEEPVIEEVVEENWDDVDDDITKPISEMSREELIKYAEDNNIDISGLTKTSQIRNAIKERI